MNKVPYYHQHTEYSCGPASLKMVLEFFGVEEREEKLRKLEHTTRKDGTKHKYMILCARKEGFYCYVHEHASVGALMRFIELGLPVIVHYMEPSSNEGHYSVVVGCSKRKILLNDPWNGKGFSLSVGDFLKRWHGKQKKHKYFCWMMVLSRKKFSVGKSYNPV